MAFDEALAARVRSLLADTRGVVEKRMFGGLVFMVHGHMGVAIHRTGLMVRMDPAQASDALRLPGARVCDVMGRPMKGWLLVSASSLGENKALAAWVNRGVSFAQSLPAK
jgi:TfoX/Sxy family transcriptional regulator of competence genes